MKKVLVIDDDKNILTTLEIHLEDLGFSVQMADSGEKGLKILKQHKPQIVLLDLKLPDRDGLKVLEDIARTEVKTDVIVITAYATIDTAVKAIKLGAFDYLPKPFTPAQVNHVIGMVEKVRSLEAEIRTLRGIVEEGDLITCSKAMHKVLAMAHQVAESNASILISGESGTGKGLLAGLIHDWSPRREGPFVTVDCTVLQENLLESDLFGHKKGAFTGALEDKEGKLKLANGGTVFLDEIAEMNPQVQSKFLRFLQHREFERLGDPKTIEVDVRVITATNRDLDELVQDGGFRQDLFFRLNVVEIHMPALRDRPEDVEIIANHYLERFSKLNKKAIKGLSQRALQMLQDYYWPGNVRELINVIERGTILARGKKLEAGDLQEYIAECKKNGGPEETLRTLAEIEKIHIQKALSKCQSMEEAARVLGIDPATLWRKRKKYYLE